MRVLDRDLEIEQGVKITFGDEELGNYFVETSKGRVEWYINHKLVAVVRANLEAGTNFMPVKPEQYSLGQPTRTWKNLYMAGYQELHETPYEPVGEGGVARMYVEDNGNGKTRLMIRFKTGDAKVVAEED